MHYGQKKCPGIVAERLTCALPDGLPSSFSRVQRYEEIPEPARDFGKKFVFRRKMCTFAGMKSESATISNGIAIVILGIASMIYGIKYGKLKSEVSILKEQQQALTVQLQHLQVLSIRPDSACTKVAVHPWSEQEESPLPSVPVPPCKP